MPQIDVNGTRINYEIEGPEDAPVLLMSNSLGTNLHMWDWQAPVFARDFRLLRYDSRGHGRSAAPEGPYTIDMLGRDAVGLLDALGIERAHYCGLSKGGMVGQWLGVNAPERLGRLILCNTSAHMPPRELWDGRIETVLKHGMEGLVQGAIERWFTPGFRQSSPQEVDKVSAMILSTPAAGYAGCCAAIRDMDQRESVRAIRLPTLVIVGAHDPATPPDHGELLHRNIPGSRLVALDSAHLSNVEATADFTRAVLAFLKGN